MTRRLISNTGRHICSNSSRHGDAGRLAGRRAGGGAGGRVSRTRQYPAAATTEKRISMQKAGNTELRATLPAPECKMADRPECTACSVYFLGLMAEIADLNG